MKKGVFLFFIALQLLQLQGCSSTKNQSFSGKLVYNIELVNPSDDSSIPFSKSIIYTNDTLVRVESESQFGAQILIKHIPLRKYYLLLEINDKKYAIQQIMSKDTLESKYVFEYKKSKLSIAGVKAKIVLVDSKDFEKPLEIWFAPSISPKYLDVLEGIKGLPLIYFVHTQEGILKYTLESIEKKEVSKDLFGIPSDYKKVTFSEFMDEMMGLNK
jgi:hypothetical protein